MIDSSNSSSTQSVRNFSHYGSYNIIIAAFLLMMVSGILMTSFGVFFKPVSTQFSWSRAETSGAFSLSVIISGISAIITGKLSDRFGPRLVAVSMSALGCLGYVLLSQMSFLWHLYIFYGVMAGVGTANVIPTISLVTRWYQKRRGFMAGIMMSGTGIGAAMFPPIATMLIQKYDWSLSYIIVGCAALFLTIVSGLLLRDPPNIRPLPSNDIVSKNGPGLKTRQFGLQKAIRTTSFWVLGIVFFCHSLAQQVLTVHIIPDATDLGISQVNAASISSVMNGACIIGCFAIGTINDRIGGKLALIVVYAIISVASILLLGARELWTFYLFAVIYGSGWGGVAILRSTVVAEQFDLRSHGVIMGAMFFISSIGGTIGPTAAGYIFDIQRGYKLVFQIIVLLYIIGLILALLLKFKKTNLKEQLY